MPDPNDASTPGAPSVGAGAAVVELLLADGRFPGGSFVHSGGLEAAVAAGLAGDAGALRRFVTGRLHHGGPLEAWLAPDGYAFHARVAIDGSAIVGGITLLTWRLLQRKRLAHWGDEPLEFTDDAGEVLVTKFAPE